MGYKKWDPSHIVIHYKMLGDKKQTENKSNMFWNSFCNASFLIITHVCRESYTGLCKKNIFKLYSNKCASLDKDFASQRKRLKGRNITFRYEAAG